MQIRKTLERYISHCSLPNKDDLYHEIIDAYDYLIYSMEIIK